MRPARIALVVVALHLIVLAFFFFKPPAYYFGVLCLSTVMVWPAAFAVGKQRKQVAVITASIIQLGIQQFAYHLWLAGQVTPWWPLAQFVALQYVIALRAGSPTENP